MPGHARRAEQVQVARIERQVVSHHVTVIDAEGNVAADQADDDVVAQIGQFRRVFRLRIAEQGDLEAGALRLVRECKVD